ncbi:hypothetical protein LINPERHAP2_LOCUS17562, partial [Linum perenne]
LLEVDGSHPLEAILSNISILLGGEVIAYVLFTF